MKRKLPVLICTLICFLLNPVSAETDREEPKKKRPTVALALEGGGALGLAHVGVIKILEKAEIPIDIVTGTSMGAIVGGLYSIGFSVPELERLATETDWINLFSEYAVARNEDYRALEDWRRYFLSLGITNEETPTSGGLLSGNRILSYMDSLTWEVSDDLDFDHLPRRYRAVATDFTTGEEVVIDRGSLAEAMRASMGIPGVFAPYELEGRLLIDGGIVNNLPVDLARSMGADIVIAVDVEGGFSSQQGYLDLSPIENLSRTIDLILDANVTGQLEHADYVIHVPLESFTAADFQRSTDIMLTGQVRTEELLDELILLRKQIMQGQTGAESEHRIKEKQTITGFRYTGGTPEEQKIVRCTLEPLVGKVITPDILASRVVSIYTECSPQQIRIHRIPGEENILEVTIESRLPRKNSLRMGLSYGGTYSNSISSKLQVTQGLVLRDLLWPGLELSLDIELLGALGIEAGAYQAFGDRFYLETGAFVRKDFDTYYASDKDESAVDYIFYETEAQVEGTLGFYPYPGSRVYIGITREWIADTAALAYLPEFAERDILLARAGFDLLRLDSPLFPMRGGAVELQLQQGLPAAGSSREFRTLSARGEGHIPLGQFVSVGYLFDSGADFSGKVDSSDSAPFLHKPEIGGRRLFPNPLSADKRFGSLVLGNGIEVTARLNTFASTIPLPLFSRFHFAAGLIYQEFDSFRESDPLFHWSSSLGAGFRINDGFGVLLRGGLAGGDTGTLHPYFAIDLGTMRNRRQH
jgi:NTE family protein